MSKRVQTLLSKMTLDEKLMLIGGKDNFFTNPVKRLGIPSIRMSDASIGIRPSNYMQPKSSTAYPASICLAATWNKKLAAKLGKAVAKEAKSCGIDILLGPGVNLYRAPMCGRNAEYMGEDPYLAGTLACEYIKAVQSQNVAAVIKHYTANNSEYDRLNTSADIDLRTLFEVYLLPFKMAVKDAKVACVMGSYNRVNGIYACQNDFLLNQVLKNKWKFDGVVISDWAAVNDGQAAALAGLDIEMPSAEYMNPAVIKKLLKNGGIEINQIDDKVRRILNLLERFNLLDKKNAQTALKIDKADCEKTALEIARQGIVLLKNKNKLLPLDRNKINNIAVIGPHSHPGVTGCGGSSYVEPNRKVSILDGIRKSAGRDTKIFWNDYLEFQSDKISNIDFLSEKHSGKTETYFQRIQKVAANSDCVVLCIGFNDGTYHEGEGLDRPYQMHETALNLIELVSNVNSNLIVALNAGSNADINSWQDKAGALLHCWYPGQNGGTAVGEILFGDVCPSGKLPISIEKKWADSPSCHSYYDKNKNRKVRYSEGIFVGYRHFEKKRIKPLYPFGFGLSYTTFEYTELKVHKNSSGSVKVNFTIENSGNVKGAETVQIYLQDINCTLARPQKELKGFTKVFLNPGQKKQVSVSLNKDAFKFFDPVKQQWTLEPGHFKIMIGSCCADIRLDTKIKYGYAMLRS